MGTGSHSGLSATALPTMYRWTARFLLLVMLAPAFGPLALARVEAQAGMHCPRHPLAEAPPQTNDTPTKSSMPCHHAAAQESAPTASDSNTSGSNTSVARASSEVFRSADCCCSQNCDCCRGTKTSEWAHPSPSYLSLVGLLVAKSLPAALAAKPIAVVFGPDSARAPPRQ